MAEENQEDTSGSSNGPEATENESDSTEKSQETEATNTPEGNGEGRISRRSYIPRGELKSDLNVLNEDVTDSALGLETGDEADDDEEIFDNKEGAHEDEVAVGSAHEDEIAVGSGQVQQTTAESAEPDPKVAEKAKENQNIAGSQRVQLISDALGDIGQAAHAVNVERKSDIIHSLPKATEDSVSGESSGSEEIATSQADETHNTNRADTIKNLFNTLGDNVETETSTATASESKPASQEPDKRSQTVRNYLLSTHLVLSSCW